MGSITHITDGDRVLNSYSYYAWGDFVSNREKVSNRFKFNGQQLAPITGQYYLRARFYNPVIGRFTQEDTYRGDGLNLYAYCGNNPIYYVDPTGHNASNANSYKGAREDLRARYYNPVIGRFTQEDTYRGDGLNLYAYCRNNPVYYVDPTGHDASNANSYKGAKDGTTESKITREEAINRAVNEFGFTREEVEKLINGVLAKEREIKEEFLKTKGRGKRFSHLEKSYKDMGPAVAGAYYRDTNTIEYAVNTKDGGLIKDIEETIRKRIQGMPQDVKDSYTHSKGAESHTEVNAVSEVLRVNENVNKDHVLIFVNYTSKNLNKVPKFQPFRTCNHCAYILDGYNIVSDINKSLGGIQWEK